MKNLCDSIREYKDALTTSSRIAATTGDLSWEDRYNKTLPLFEKSYNDIELLVRGNLFSVPSEFNTSVYTNLIQKEREAFKVLRDRDNDKETAVSLLFSSEYDSLNSLYDREMNKYLSVSKNTIDETLDQKEKHTSYSIISLILYVLFALIVLYLLRRRAVDKSDNRTLSIKKIFMILSTVMIILIMTVFGTSVLLLRNRKVFNKYQQIHYDALKLASELRDSSELLTRMARLYVMTQNPYFEYEYWHILDVRNGKKSRSDGRVIPLRSLMEQLNLTEEERDLLKTGEDRSNKLAGIEEIAMNAVKGVYRDTSGTFTIRGTPDIAYAQELMFNSAYFQMKTDIMHPIAEFKMKVDNRTSTIVAIYRSREEMYTLLQIVIISGYIVFVFSSFVYLKNRIIKPVLEGSETSSKIAQGDLSARWEVHQFDEIGIFSENLNLMVNEIESKYRIVKETQLLLKSSIESPIDMIILSIDKNYNYIYFNNTHQTGMKLSYNVDIKVGMNILDCIAIEKDKKEAGKCFSRALSGESHTTVSTFGRKGIFYETLYSPIINEDNEIVGATAFAQDITERKKIEETLRLHSEVMSNMVEGVYLIGLNDGKIVMANPRFEKMFGYDQGELIGKHVSVVNAPSEEDPEQTAKKILDDISKNGEWHGEVKNIKKDGTEFWCYANVSIFSHHEYGDVLVSVHTDITNRKLVENEKEILIRELQEALDEVKTLQDFIPICSVCKNIRDDQGYWNQVETYISKHTGSQFSHGICPDCREKLYPDLGKKRKDKT